MTSRYRFALAAALLMHAMAACKGASDTTVPPVGDQIRISARASSVFANGVNSVILDVSTTGSGPLTVRTNRGTFPGGAQAVTVDGASGSVVLTTCNVATDPACAGTARITAAKVGASAFVEVSFGGIALCAADCSIDADLCTAHSCSSATVPSGFCSAGACAPPPTVTVAPTPSRALANGTNTVSIAASTSGSGPITVTTNRGTFPGGATSATIPGASGNVTLTTCNAATSATCVGAALITATDETGTKKTAQVEFGTTQLCASDCSIDAVACDGHACSSATVTGGTCTAGVCTPPSSVTVRASPTSVLADGVATVSLTVATNGSGPISVATDRGTLSQTSIAGSSGTLTLTSCNSATDSLCAGAATITATDATRAKGTAQVSFVDVTSGAAITVAPGRARLPADGTNTTPIVVKVTRNRVAAAGVPVTIQTTLGTLSATTATTGTDGTATVTFTASSTSGVATIGASMTAVPNVSASTTVTMPALGPIQLGSLQYSVMGVRGSGYREISAVTVAVLDDQNKSYPDGLAVHFEHAPLGGSGITGTPANSPPATCSGTPGCVAFDGVTDAGGLARVNLASGTVAGTLLVTVSASAGGLVRTYTAPNVAVVGAKASGGNFSIVCAPRNVPALAETNCTTSDVDQQFNCQALLKDRFGNLLGTQTQVTFLSEAGAVGPPTSTPLYAPGTTQSDLGVAKQYFRTLGAGLPAPVPSDVGEPAAPGVDACGRSLHPRNGIVTVIAVADGEEAFTDLNGNGVYDGPGSANLPAEYQASGEPFIDLGEPFVDANDNGVHDDNEEYVDANQSRTYQGPNGVWDANAKIWTQTVVVYTGHGETLASGVNLLGTRWADAAAFVDACTETPAASFAAHQNSSSPFVVVASDRNLNRLAGSTAYSVGKTPATAPITVGYQGLARYADDLGFAFQYFVCDKNGANCSDRCLAAPADLPCIMKPVVSGYSCGLAAAASVRGPTTAVTGTTACTADWHADTTYTVFGSSKTVKVLAPMSGVVSP